MGFKEEATTSSHHLAIPATDATPLLQSQDPDQKLSSQAKTFANVFIAIVGAGVLGLPYTFLRTGFLTGTLLLLVVAVLSFHCMLLLVLSRRRLHLSLHPKPLSSFGDLALAASGPFAVVAVDSMIVLSQAGFCVSYLIFVSTTLAHLFPFLSKPMFLLLLVPFQLGLNAIKTLTHLAPLSIFADIVDLAAMAVVMIQCTSRYLEFHAPSRAFNGFYPLFYGVGVAIYAFEGVGMVLPLESEARDKSKFPSTLAVAMFLIAIMYTLFGVLGYLAFGDATSDIITTNLGTGVLTGSVQIGLCINLFFTFPLMMNPVHEVMERRFAGKSYNLLLRWVMVLLVALVALSVPNFADFLSLVGSCICCVLAFVLPAYFHLRVFKGENGLWWVASDVAIIVTGMIFAVMGTYSSLQEIFFSVSA